MALSTFYENPPRVIFVMQLTFAERASFTQWSITHPSPLIKSSRQATVTLRGHSSHVGIFSPRIPLRPQRVKLPFGLAFVSIIKRLMPRLLLHFLLSGYFLPPPPLPPFDDPPLEPPLDLDPPLTPVLIFPIFLILQKL